MILSQIWAKLLNSSNYGRFSRLLNDCRIINLSDNHNNKVGICEEVQLIERMLWNIYLSKELEKTVDLIGNPYIEKVKNLPQ